MSVVVQPAEQLPPFGGPADKPAIIMGGSGETVSYSELMARANQFGHLLRQVGLRAGETVAVCLENGPEFLYAAVAAFRSGFVFVPVSCRLLAGEIAFIVADSGARALITSPAVGDFEAIPDAVAGHVVLITTGGEHPPYLSWREAKPALPETPVPDARKGEEMFYSSGTTGRPKGIYYQAVAGVRISLLESIIASIGRMGITQDDVYLCPAPLYHGAPCTFSIAMLSMGATVVVMERFDPADALALIERYGITVSQWVPTHFVRMLKLPETQRRSFDLSSHRLAIHAAAPCPVPVKHAMIEWWGPIILEYFGSSEQAMLTMIGSEEWLSHPGSVGRSPTGGVHICDENGDEVPTGTIGAIYAEGGAEFAYHGDPIKTAATRNKHGWTTVGDLGHLDQDGYLFLTDRKGFMIITGGVNVYPQEVENLLVTHPKVADAAVIGLPDPEMGERVTAVIKPLDMNDAGEDFARELDGWLRKNLSSVKCPKQILFRSDLPRLPTGKMVKHKLRDQIVSELTDDTA